MRPTWKLTLGNEVTVKTAEPHCIAFECPTRRTVWRGLSPGSCRAFQSVVDGATVAELMSAVRESGDPGESSSLLAKLRSLIVDGWLRVSAEADSRPLATLEALSREFKFDGPPLPERFCLSRFAHLRRYEDGLILETPLCAARVQFCDSIALEMIFRLLRPQTANDLLESLPCGADAAADLLELLHTAGALTGAGDDGMTSEDVAPGLQFWEFHDLLFHSRSREGRNDLPVGATFFWAGYSDSPPAVVTNPELPAVPLETPPDYPSEDPASLANIFERRRSVRNYHPNPITARDLGHLLYRVGRVTERYNADMETWNGPVPMEFAARPYPAGGGLYEIELYPLVVRCDGLDAGLYHYDAVRHGLVRIDADESDLAQISSDAAYAATMSPEDVQVVILLSARFPRIMWKYSAMAYAAILKHVGVLYQSMYLTATDLQLAPCAVGIGNSDAFAKAVKSDYYSETSVGEFLLGSYPDAVEEF